MRHKNIVCAALAAMALNAQAQECEMAVSIKLDEGFANVPAAASSILYQSLKRIAVANGVTSEASMTPFVLNAHCDVIDKSNLQGPPMQTVQNMGLTLYISDSQGTKQYASSYVELKGVGSNETKCYIDAFKRLNASNKAIKTLMSDGKAAMMAYYDSQFDNIMKEVKRLESAQLYEEALSAVLAVPLCSKGGEKAQQYATELYAKNLDRFNTYILNQARAIWAANQTKETAAQACALLAQIDPEAKCYSDASNLMTEIKSQMRSDIDFAMREKYRDSVELERSRIESAKAVGVAYGNGQKERTTNIIP